MPKWHALEWCILVPLHEWLLTSECKVHRMVQNLWPFFFTSSKSLYPAIKPCASRWGRLTTWLGKARWAQTNCIPWLLSLSMAAFCCTPSFKSLDFSFWWDDRSQPENSVILHLLEQRIRLSPLFCSYSFPSRECPNHYPSWMHIFKNLRMSKKQAFSLLL